MILVGMSQSPPAPNGVTANSKSCSEIMIKWDSSVKNDNLDFPIHKYIVQRLVVQKPAAKSGNDKNWYMWEFLNQTFNASEKAKEVISSSSASLSSGSFHHSTLHNAAGWITVFEGSGQDSFFEDLNLEKEATYRYRIISWNAVGHSSYVYIETTTVSNPCDSTQFQTWGFFSSLSLLYNWANFISYYLNAILMITAICTFQRLPLPLSFKVFLLDILITWSKFLSTWMRWFPDVSDYLERHKKHFEAEIENIRMNSAKKNGKINHTSNSSGGVGLRRNGSRDGFNGDGSDDTNRGLKRRDSDLSVKSANNSDDENSGSRKICYICRGPIGALRCKHTCNKCHKLFCSQCGCTSHQEFFSCKVPSTCQCDNCGNNKKKREKKSSIFGIAVKKFKSGIKSRGSRTDLDDLVNADEIRNGVDRTTSGGTGQPHLSSASNVHTEGRPPRPGKKRDQE